ncbi:MAG TPA: 3-hydroxyacyl-CoA dehydrogenase NAD-binding domain-containing protein [Gemmatimonadaceae bacterium]|nr:3-hydroxyacyl-CoA dehydrogenase NAD-binding domain-containing protein [Gemmatimonadaceae bacterium]
MKRAVVIGAGEIGGGWAALFAVYGADVTLVDPDPDALARARAALREAQALGVGGGAPGNLTIAREFERAVADAEWIQEATPEAADLKRSLFSRVESLASSDAIIASSTSSLTRIELSGGMRDPARLSIVHPLHPVYAVPIVEVNVDAALPRDAVERVLATLRSLGRDPILVAGDRPGLVANRLTAAVLREALDLIASGAIRAADLDRLVARGIALGWAVHGPLTTEIIGAALDAPEGLPDALDGTLAPLWGTLASWASLDATARSTVERDLRSSLGEKRKAHAAGESTWAKTLSRVARAAEAD